jgi:hypothetical protein
MSALINALDNHTPKQLGENGHVEYGWSNSIKERILQFSFQVTRTDENGVIRLERVLDGLLSDLRQRVKQEEEGIVDLLILLYKMIGHTRDIIDGKGECSLTYMMIVTWHRYYPELAIHALKCLVDLGGEIHQYGSWKDIKYLCHYCLQKKKYAITHPLIQNAIEIANQQIKQDYESYCDGHNLISLAARWVPREKSNKFGGKLYQAFACHYFARYIETSNWANEAIREHSRASAILKCKTDYRKMLSTLNKKLDTVQIKQCGKTWAEIDFLKVTSVSLSKQKKAFLNVNKKGETRCPHDPDRIYCAEHFTEHIGKAVKGETEMKGKRVGLNDFTKQAIDLLGTKNNPSSQVEMDLLNSQWRDNSSQTGALGKIIPMVDVSGSMSGDPINVAIALGIRVAEKSLLGKRVMTFTSTPTWVSLDGVDTFTDMVEIVQKAEWDMSTNFMAALDMILDAIVASKLPPNEVEDMVLVIFSDMQINHGDPSWNNGTMYDSIKEKYDTTGLKLFGQPFRPPHILFWNLRSTSGFPALSTQPITSMMSGFSPALLNLFCDQGLEALQTTTPWALFERSLENTRYSVLESKARETFN